MADAVLRLAYLALELCAQSLWTVYSSAQEAVWCSVQEDFLLDGRRAGGATYRYRSARLGDGGRDAGRCCLAGLERLGDEPGYMHGEDDLIWIPLDDLVFSLRLMIYTELGNLIL